MKYETIIGLEIHVELTTNTKMFCRCKVATLTDKPNSNTCPICLGLPGALPYTNKKAIEDCIKIAMALDCKINKKSFFERKNYFYPDLAKGFQTSQYLQPFGENGKLEIETNGIKKTIGITRVHMEEDTGKLTHLKINGEEKSLIDFNRSGVPLVEIVTDPDIRSGEEAKAFLIKLQQIIRYLDVSDADMEKGHMRLEPNISLRKVTTENPVINNELPKYKVEVKNINSFRFVEKAIKYEELRHQEILDKGNLPTQETRGWNEFKNMTVSQRSKEEAHDYRYFPEPDIPPIEFSDDELRSIENKIPELPDEKKERFRKQFNISEYFAEIITRDKNISSFFEEAVVEGAKLQVEPKNIADYIINRKTDFMEVPASNLVQEIKNQKNQDPIDEAVLQEAIENALKENQKAVNDFKNGKENALMFLLGTVMRNYGKKADVNIVKNAILEQLKK